MTTVVDIICPNGCMHLTGDWSRYPADPKCLNCGQMLVPVGEPRPIDPEIEAFIEGVMNGYG